MKKFLIIFVAIIAVALPWFSNNYLLSVINLTAIAIISSHGLNILTGYTGLISLGHAAFMGVGAYAAAILFTKLHVPWVISIFVAGLISALVGMIFGVPSLRLRGMYLAMATLAAQILLVFVFEQWKGLTGGVSGFYIKSPDIFGITLGTDQHFYYLSTGMAALATWGVYNLFRTRTGRAFIAIRDKDLAAAIVGIPVFRYKLYSFGISSFYAGIAGALLAFYMTFASPESFGLPVTIQYIAMVIIGGMGTISGSILGAAFVTMLPQALEFALKPFESYLPEYGFSALRDIIFGLLIILFLILEPKGLTSTLSRVIRLGKRNNKSGNENEGNTAPVHYTVEADSNINQGGLL